MGWIPEVVGDKFEEDDCVNNVKGAGGGKGFRGVTPFTWKFQK